MSPPELQLSAREYIKEVGGMTENKYNGAYSCTNYHPVRPVVQGLDKKNPGVVPDKASPGGLRPNPETNIHENMHGSQPRRPQAKP